LKSPRHLILKKREQNSTFGAGKQLRLRMDWAASLDHVGSSGAMTRERMAASLLLDIRLMRGFYHGAHC
jgi:hypothetical protein